MPAWLIGFLLDFVLKFGLPLIVDWIRKRWPNLLPTVGPVLTQYVKDIEEGKLSKKEAKERARRRLRECHGIGCPPDLKKEE